MTDTGSGRGVAIGIAGALAAGAAAALLVTTLTVSGYMDFTETAAPAVSPSGKCRVYADSTAHDLKVSKNGGAYAAIGGGTTIASLTQNKLSKANATGDNVVNSSVLDTGTAVTVTNPVTVTDNAGTGAGALKLQDTSGGQVITIATASNEAADRALTIPALGGDKTLQVGSTGTVANSLVKSSTNICADSSIVDSGSLVTVSNPLTVNGTVTVGASSGTGTHAVTNSGDTDTYPANIGANAGNKYAITSNVVTITTYQAHNLTAGQIIEISSCGEAHLDDRFLVASTPTTTTFTFALTHGDIVETADANMTIEVLHIRRLYGDTSTSTPAILVGHDSSAYGTTNACMWMSAYKGNKWIVNTGGSDLNINAPAANAAIYFSVSQGQMAKIDANSGVSEYGFSVSTGGCGVRSIYGSTAAYMLKHAETNNQAVGSGVSTWDTSANFIPANVLVKAVTVRIRTQPGGTSTYQAGDGSTADKFIAAATTTAAGYADSITSKQMTPYVSAGTIVRLTFDTPTTDTAGRVDVFVFYEQATHP